MSADHSMSVAIYGLEVPVTSDEMPSLTFSNPDGFPGKYRITMAAIDPTVEAAPGELRRATLKMVRLNYPLGDSDDEDYDEDDDEEFDSDDVDAIERRLAMQASDDEDSDDQANGGPGEKTKKARAEALKKAIKEAEEAEDAMDVELVNGVNGKTAKGKGKASDDEDDESDDDDIESAGEDEIQEFTLCTLDPERHYQQTLDITVDAREQVFFKVIGGYNVHLTGNYIATPEEMDEDYDEDSDEEDGLEGLADLEGISDEEDYSEEDELDDIEDPRVMEVDSDEEEAPKLVKAVKGDKASKKRAADALDDEDVLKKVLQKETPATNGDAKLSKSQAKKLKNNAGQAASAPVAETKAGAEKKDTKKETPVKNAKEQANGSDKKKVQFAEKLVQDQPTKSEPKADAKPEKKADGKKTWKTNGVTIDERKAGSGKQAKAGDKCGMRYIGKLKDGKVFDSNTKGEPFKFKLGKGEVIKGWDVGVAGMAVGGERRITVPPKLAYGNQKIPGIPPNSELTFDIKLISIN